MSLGLWIAGFAALLCVVCAIVGVIDKRHRESASKKENAGT